MNTPKIYSWRSAFVSLAVAVLVAGPALAAQKAGSVTDDIGVITIPKRAPLQIAGYWVLTGPDSALGIDQKRGVEIAIKDFDGKLVGHPIKFTAEDAEEGFP